jgi:hypothetical protein
VGSIKARNLKIYEKIKNHIYLLGSKKKKNKNNKRELNNRIKETKN